jgi:hypothetical protein
MLLFMIFKLQGSFWPLGFAMRSCSMLRNRMLADPAFLFKIGSEVCLDCLNVYFLSFFYGRTTVS